MVTGLAFVEPNDLISAMHHAGGGGRSGRDQIANPEVPVFVS